jgi:hypothetical protein
VATVLVALLTPALAPAASGAVRIPSSGIRPLSSEEAQAQLDAVIAEQAASEQRLVELEAEREALRAEFAGLAVEQQELVAQLEAARARAMSLAIGAYVAGDSSDQVSYFFAADEATDLAWRQEMLSIHSDATTDAADEYERLSEEAEEQLGDLANRGAENEAAIAQTRSDLELYPEAIRIAEAKLFQAKAEEAAARRGATAEGWAALRACESGGNYSTNTGNGFYGAYQFDLQTWGSVGGTGLPSDAPPEEQDARAAALYAQRGSQPWPVCGRFL